ncbi:hypothetical protein [Streptomyces sp. NPDC057052]|uniref:hypothetical protein n=1 Tax=Streptomyces sp. NPDC057052 TaxID=3346010 RepID=UPI00363E3404
MPASEDEAPSRVAVEPAGALLTRRVPRAARAAVLFLRGGRSDSRAPHVPGIPRPCG